MKQSPRRIPARELGSLAQHILMAVGMDDAGARIAAKALLEADLRGVDSHGVRQVPRYARAIADHAIDGRVVPGLTRQFGATAVVDAGHGMGHPAAMLAATTAASLAQAHGVGLVTVRNSNHFGAAFPYVEAIADEGCLGFVTTNGPPVMVPFGGSRAAICNNPLAWAIPTRRAPRIVLDMACSAAARGRIRLAQREGRRIPTDWATDTDGTPTDDPTAALAGFLQSVGGPKGYGLAVVNEILAGALTASPVLSAVPSEVVTSDRFSRSMDIGHALIAIDPRALTDQDDFLDRVETIRDELARVEPRPGVDEVLLPGEIEFRTRLDREANGVPLASSTTESFVALVAERGLAVELPPAMAGS